MDTAGGILKLQVPELIVRVNVGSIYWLCLICLNVGGAVHDSVATRGAQCEMRGVVLRYYINLFGSALVNHALRWSEVVRSSTREYLTLFGLLLNWTCRCGSFLWRSHCSSLWRRRPNGVSDNRLLPFEDVRYIRCLFHNGRLLGGFSNGAALPGSHVVNSELQIRVLVALNDGNFICRRLRTDCLDCVAVNCVRDILSVSDINWLADGDLRCCDSVLLFDRLLAGACLCNVLACDSSCRVV